MTASFRKSIQSGEPCGSSWSHHSSVEQSTCSIRLL